MAGNTQAQREAIKARLRRKAMANTARGGTVLDLIKGKKAKRSGKVKIKPHASILGVRASGGYRRD